MNRLRLDFCKFKKENPILAYTGLFLCDFLFQRKFIFRFFGQGFITFEFCVVSLQKVR